MNLALGAFFVLAVTGLFLSLISHVAACLDLPQPLGDSAMALHVGVFVVWLPAVFVSKQLTANVKKKDFWRAALRGCPYWMRALTAIFFFYAIINFILFACRLPPKKAHLAADSPIAVRGFSGHWMAFYSAGAAMLYSAIAIGGRGVARRCENGHPASASAKFCEKCGAQMVDESFKEQS